MQCRPVRIPSCGMRWAAAALLAAAPIPAAAHPPAAAVVRAFYRYHFAHEMAFTRAAVRRRARWLAPDLLARCRAYFARSSPADGPPDIDGDPFTDSQEYPATFRVGATTRSGDTALVAVRFSWRTGGRRDVTVVLVGARAWRIADVRYATGSSLRAELAGGA